MSNFDELREELIFDLTEELNIDENFDSKLLERKVRAVINEVKTARRYPKSYSDEKMEEDMRNYYSQMRNIALFDYNQIGIEGQTSSNENGISRSYINRNSLFNGILPISRVM